jgi:hypothetical protein
MEINEAPDKIYLIRNISTSTSLNTTNDCHEKYRQEWYNGREKDADVEYIRTDAFIEKACEFLKDRIEHDSIDYPMATNHLIEDFKKYMKGK